MAWEKFATSWFDSKKSETVSKWNTGSLAELILKAKLHSTYGDGANPNIFIVTADKPIC